MKKISSVNLGPIEAQTTIPLVGKSSISINPFQNDLTVKGLSGKLLA